MSKKVEISEAINLAESIEYASSSIVSKSVIKKTAGNISLFAFDKGEGLAEHSSPHEALVQILDGVAKIIIGGDPITVCIGESVILPANIPHSLQAEEKFKMMLTMIKD